jgi:hypothetical protein
MARRTRRKSRKSKSSRRRRQRGGSTGVAKHAADFGAEPVVQGEGEDAPTPEQKGGRRRKRKGKSTKKKTRKKKRKLNPFFKLMLAAKKKGAPSFKYKGRTYKGKKHHRLGMIYKKA